MLFLSAPYIYSTLLTKYLSVFLPTHCFVTFITAWEERQKTQQIYEDWKGCLLEEDLL